MSRKAHFMHRENLNGTTDSICCTCFVTVATARNEFELAEPERGHVCDPVLLKHWKEMAKGEPEEDFAHSQRFSYCFAWGS
jgi:hypothetical protein